MEGLEHGAVGLGVHVENGLHSVQSASPMPEYMSRGHSSWCSFPTQYWPKGQSAHAPSTQKVPAAQALHSRPTLEYPGSHTQSSRDVEPGRDRELAEHGTQVPLREYVSWPHNWMAPPMQL